MRSLALNFVPTARRWPLVAAGGVLLALGGAALVAQVSGERGIAPVAASTDIEVADISVNVTGDSAEDARQNGWREAEKLAWKKIGGPAISEGQLQSLVSAIVIQKEQLGPRRYIATLGVIFDRARAGGLLGGGGERARSAPMLTLPVLISGGAATIFEVRNPWQRAWAEYQSGASAVDYVRPVGSGGDSLLLTYGQTGRRSRVWWNDLLGQFGAADLIIPIARLNWEYPGGPVLGEFTARYGPDNRYLGSFKLRARNGDAVPAMLSQAVRRFDAIFTRALAEGQLQPDPTLALDGVEIAPEIQALIDASIRAEADAAALRAQDAPAATPSTAPTPGATSTPVTEEPQEVASFTVQVATADAGAVDAALASVRSAPGVRGVAASSIAIGGTSVLRVSFAGDLAALAQALQGRGWQVAQGANALSITR